ncbi:hypothetical protein EYC59_04750 [Candidatus Saccharibacteria bacterium]|nr:MAG: hypothetical protein EYC59_04750 [Candidatus Saccharibacteria bacterium]
MNEDVIADLKQFITATVSQQTAELKAELKGDIGDIKAEIGGIKADIGDIKAELQELRQEMHDGFAGVADAMEPTNATVDDHETRIIKLERQRA